MRKLKCSCSKPQYQCYELLHIVCENRTIILTSWYQSQVTHERLDRGSDVYIQYLENDHVTFAIEGTGGRRQTFVKS